MWLFFWELPQNVLGALNLALYAMLHRTLTGKRWAHYYDGWPEKQADLLGGADVSRRPRP